MKILYTFNKDTLGEVGKPYTIKLAKSLKHYKAETEKTITFEDDETLKRDQVLNRIINGIQDQSLKLKELVFQHHYKRVTG